jgi:hypothetical protein
MIVFLSFVTSCAMRRKIYSLGMYFSISRDVEM